MKETDTRARGLSSRLGAWMLRCGGWRVVGRFPNESSVIIVAPHTSNWDFLWLLMLGFQWQAIGKVLWVGKHTIFRGPIGTYFCSIGGIPVNRNQHNHIVGTIARRLQEGHSLHFALAPEGTRSKTSAWKKGFYYIAQRASVPVALAFINYRDRSIGIGPSLNISGVEEEDLGKIRDFYQADWARYPKNFSPVRFEQTGRVARENPKEL